MNSQGRLPFALLEDELHLSEEEDKPVRRVVSVTVVPFNTDVRGFPVPGPSSPLEIIPIELQSESWHDIKHTSI